MINWMEFHVQIPYNLLNQNLTENKKHNKSN